LNILLTPFDDSQFAQFTTWLDTTPLGAYIKQAEQAWFDHVSIDIFGYKAMQLQLPHIDFLRQSRIPWRIRAAEEAGGTMQCSGHALPIATQSLDLLVLPHVLDFARYPREVLREAERVLMPEGRLLMTGFNPWSLWAWRRIARRDPWKGNWLSLPRLKDWLALMGFESMQGKYLAYTWPLQHAKWMACDQRINDIGNRWWPAAGAVYCLDMIKRVPGLQMIKPRWRVPLASAVAVREPSCKVNKGCNE
jgi:SAM-dependent methyltransferase